ncbi:unnamed protein product [Trichobilharzia szidati]|nr:unnamed protein product [Trichobilharzia szidati]
MSTPDRKAELEMKKAKLAILREKKMMREKSKFDGTNGVAQDALSPSQGLRDEAEELLRTLGIPVTDETNQSSDEHSSKLHVESPQTKPVTPKKSKKLGFSEIYEVNLSPKNPVCYSKTTQTRDSPVSRHPVLSDSMRSDLGLEVIGSPKFTNHLEWDDEFSFALPFDGSTDVNFSHSSIIGEFDKLPPFMPKVPEEEEQKTVKDTKKELTVEERDGILESSNFLRFFDKASRLMERALTETSNIFVDYSGGDHDDSGNTKRHELVGFNRDFFDERWSGKRCVTALEWSHVFPELLLAAYSSNEDAQHDANGVCLIWNIKFQKTSPEYIFYCQSTVTSATLATYHPNLVIGGTYSGQIVLWDNRANKRTPVQRTQLCAAAHTHPVKTVMIVGGLNSHHLLSVSSDGKLCTWSLDMLSQPQQSIELTHRQARTVAATCMCLADANVNSFLVGAEDGRAYSGLRHGNLSGIIEAYEGHRAPIFSIASHPIGESELFSPLFLTTSMDWTVKLWSVKDNVPLCSFNEFSDYVFDAQWSPVHPSVFATVDCEGNLCLWNLNKDMEVPTVRTVINGQPALNKCRFHSSGMNIAVGDDSGRVHLFDLKGSLVYSTGEDYVVFARTVNGLRQNVAEQKESETDQLLGLMGGSPSSIH